MLPTLPRSTRCVGFPKRSTASRDPIRATAKPWIEPQTADLSSRPAPRHLAGAKTGQTPLPPLQLLWYYTITYDIERQYDDMPRVDVEKGLGRMMLGFGLLLLLLVGGFVAFVSGGGERLRRTESFRPSEQRHQQAPRVLLDERLAQGEIDLNEYEAIRARLEG